MTASVTAGRALRYAGGSARGLLHHHPGHCRPCAPRTQVRSSRLPAMQHRRVGRWQIAAGRRVLKRTTPAILCLRGERLFTYEVSELAVDTVRKRTRKADQEAGPAADGLRRFADEEGAAQAHGEVRATAGVRLNLPTLRRRQTMGCAVTRSTAPA
jgi:hypothetical protein